MIIIIISSLAFHSFKYSNSHLNTNKYNTVQYQSNHSNYFTFWISINYFRVVTTPPGGSQNVFTLSRSLYHKLGRRRR